MSSPEIFLKIFQGCGYDEIAFCMAILGKIWEKGRSEQGSLKNSASSDCSEELENPNVREYLLPKGKNVVASV
jgi:hypothetical protein